MEQGTSQPHAFLGVGVCSSDKGNASNKQPRSDVLLVAPDPLNNYSLRPVVSLEAKLASFTLDDEYQSKSNAIDAFSRQPEGKIPWPLFALRIEIGGNHMHADVVAVVPVEPTKTKLVHLYETDQETGFLCPLHDFLEELNGKDVQSAPVNFSSV